MAVYGRLKAKNGGSLTDFFPKTYANLVYMKGNTAQTVQSRISDIISGTQKVGSASKADNATTAASATAGIVSIYFCNSAFIFSLLNIIYEQIHFQDSKSLL